MQILKRNKWNERIIILAVTVCCMLYVQTTNQAQCRVELFQNSNDIVLTLKRKIFLTASRNNMKRPLLKTK